MELTGSDVIGGKQSNADVTVDVPLLSLTVGLTTVIHKARVVAFWTSVNDSTHSQRPTKTMTSSCH